MKYLFYYIFFMIIVLFFAYINSRTVPKEPFTPKMRELYRPYIRKARVISENFYNNKKQGITNLFRKVGIM